jgi:hypothetical protein
MNLNDSNDGMVPLYPPASSQPQQPPAPPPPQQYQPAPPKVYEKNIPKHQTTMDSTPIADIMQDSMDSQDPRAQQYMQNMMPPPPMSASAMGPPQQKPQVAAASKNPLNLSDEQMRALIAGVCAIIAFSSPVQDKLSTTIPQFLTEAGSRSTTGLIATGLIAALVFYFAQRFLNK